MRVLVFGNSGSGKSTYARALAAQHPLPHLDLDTIVWEPGLIAVQRPTTEVADTLTAYLLDNDLWVIEGCYGELIQVAASHCSQLVFLNPGLETCLMNNRRRPWEPHKYSSIEQQSAMLETLQAWVADYYTRGGPWSYSEHLRIFASHAGSKVEYTSAIIAP